MPRFITLFALAALLPAAHAASLQEHELTRLLERVAKESSVGTPRAINEDILDQGYTVEGNELVNHLSVRAAHAEQMSANPATVRQHMSALRNAQLLNCTHGHPRPELALPPEQITLLAVYRAVEGTKPLLHLDTHTNPECGVGVNIQLALQDYYDKVQEQAEAAMAQITLRDILNTYEEKLK